MVKRLNRCLKCDPRQALVFNLSLCSLYKAVFDLRCLIQSSQPLLFIESCLRAALLDLSLIQHLP